ncbi:MAG TPA: bifunctional glutamate N-acetyltransferase/amino-acid acetyltransferase ArgJ [Mycobacteriales bacterium]|nr:bifunctional glutamate N-acetyltransferase/amino-acid acetyltransferase ArgJ [Mycobacteriales bacterium]
MSVTAARGFRASGVVAGIKSNGRPDLALVVADRTAAAAGVFTRNQVQAAPVRLSREAVSDGRLRAVVLNSGGANACTGAAGAADAVAMAAAVSAAVGCPAHDVAVASTGLIGTRLPMRRELAGIGAAAGALGPAGGTAAATAIMTTDTVCKEASVQLAGAAAGVTIGGMAKGAGMLAPALATMLAVVTTDADVASADLDRALRTAVARTFDRVDVDGCMSTNDTVLLLASARSGVIVAPGTPAWPDFVTGLGEVCSGLANQLVDDAEGASKRIAIKVVGGADEEQAVAAARGVARSALLKCAIHGADPNWGRVLAALGTTGIAFDPEAVDITFNGEPVCAGGVAAGDPEAARAALAPREVTITIDLHAGASHATVLTTDLTAEYVHENSAYST